MTGNNTLEDKSSEGPGSQSAKAVDDQLIEELVGQAQVEGLQLNGERTVAAAHESTPGVGSGGRGHGNVHASLSALLLLV
ncbi:hypothetical protein OIE76_40650 (plasmid) [Streptomyces sp. NBC_01727]|nr:hypothetical protein OIE76_40650 [Streptomyces sp. NBC_01727]